MERSLSIDVEIGAVRLQGVAYILARHGFVPNSCLRYAGEVDGMRLVREWAKADRETFARIMGVRMSPFEEESLYRSYVTPSYAFTAPFTADPVLALPGKRRVIHLSEIERAILSSCDGGMQGADARRLQEAYMFKPHTEVVRNVFHDCCLAGRVLQPGVLCVTRDEALSSTYKLHMEATACDGVDDDVLGCTLRELHLEACRSAGVEPEQAYKGNHTIQDS